MVEILLCEKCYYPYPTDIDGTICGVSGCNGHLVPITVDTEEYEKLLQDALYFESKKNGDKPI